MEDAGEHVTVMEPMLVGESGRHRDQLADLALELTARSTGFRRSLPEGIVDALSNLVRAMNCYYSNLIEGHETHPIDIERAMNGVYSADPKKRNLQLEARAHIQVQKWIDENFRRSDETIKRAHSKVLPRSVCVVTGAPGAGGSLMSEAGMSPRPAMLQPAAILSDAHAGGSRRVLIMTAARSISAWSRAHADVSEPAGACRAGSRR